MHAELGSNTWTISIDEVKHTFWKTCLVDKFGSFALYEKGRDDLVASSLNGDSL